MKSKFMTLEESELLEMIEYAKSSGIGLNDRDENGDTYLHYCVKQGHRELVKILCQSGANIYAKNTQGLRPIDTAWEDKGGHDILGIILWHSPLACDKAALKESKYA
jgi:hypothetical protein